MTTKKLLLTVSMEKFLEARPHFGSDAAAARHVGLKSKTVGSWRAPSYPNPVVREEFIRRHEIAKKQAETAEPETNFKKGRITEELKDAAIERYSEAVNLPIDDDTSPAMAKVILGASKDVLVEAGELGQERDVKPIAVILQQFLGDAKPNFNARGDTLELPSSTDVEAEWRELPV